MPYYHWRGVDIAGRVRKGKVAASSLQHLDTKLFKQGIALTVSKQVRPSWFLRSVRLPQKIHLFKQLATLMNAGVLLPEALAIVADQLSHPHLQEIMHQLATSVRNGDALSAAMRNASDVFDPLIIHMMSIGQESGNLAQASEGVAQYLEIRHAFQKRIQSALAMPLVTGVFFIIVAGIIFGAIMPRFVDLFSSMQQEVPALTQSMIAVSAFVRSWRMLGLIGMVGIMVATIKRYVQSMRGKPIRDWLSLHLPFVGSVVQNTLVAQQLHAMSVLLARGMPLVQALRITRDVGQNDLFNEQLSLLHDEVAAGSALSTAMASIEPALFTPESMAMVRVGEESGSLSTVLEKAALGYHDAVNRQLRVLTLVVQPLCMILLGLLVALLIFAVYIPIINFSQVI